MTSLVSDECQVDREYLCRRYSRDFYESVHDLHRHGRDLKSTQLLDRLYQIDTVHVQARSEQYSIMYM